MNTDQRPNILVIMTDQHDKSAMGCAGHQLVRTPHLDRLAGEGMRMTDAYCPAPLCAPSRMSFMTCRTPSQNQVWDNRHALGGGAATWAHVLGGAGYETSLIGRMHFVGSDQRHGFELRPTGEFMANHHGSPVQGGPMWQHYSGASCGQSRAAVEVAGHGHTHYQWQDEHVTSVAEDYLRQRADRKNGATNGRPFACVVGYLLPHCPFIAQRELFEYYYDKVDIPRAVANQPATIERFRRNRGLVDPELSDDQVRAARAAYFGLVEHVDGLIGRVLDALDESNLSRNTLVVYCSDHGEMTGVHGCWWKSNFYEGSAGVPLIARLPGVIDAGQQSGAVCNLMDLGVTFADMAGADYGVAHAGRSLWPTLRGEHPGDWGNETFSEFVDSRIKPYSPSRMVRQGAWKLWKAHDEDDLPPALFNLGDDPDELCDLHDDPAHAAVRDRLLKRLYEGWDPQEVVSRSMAMDADYEAMCRWGRVLKPAHPDALAMPDASYEADVRLM